MRKESPERRVNHCRAGPSFRAFFRVLVWSERFEFKTHKEKKAKVVGTFSRWSFVRLWYTLAHFCKGEEDQHSSSTS